MAWLGHSASQAPQLMHSEVIFKAMLVSSLWYLGPVGSVGPAFSQHGRVAQEERLEAE